MKLRMFAFAAISFGLICAALAGNDGGLAAQEDRWITVDGPYACPSKEDLQRIATTAPTRQNCRWSRTFRLTTSFLGL